MPFYLAARNDTKATLEVGSNSLNLADSTILASFRAALCSNYGIVDGILSLYTVAAADLSAITAMDGGSYSVVWSGNTITGLDTSAESSKRIVKISCSKSTFLADGTDTNTITIQVWKADNTAIDTAVNATIDLPVLTPTGNTLVRITVASGQYVKTLTTTKPGHWKIPADIKRFGNVRIAVIAEFDSVVTMASL